MCMYPKNIHQVDGCTETKNQVQLKEAVILNSHACKSFQVIFLNEHDKELQIYIYKYKETLRKRYIK